MYSFHMKVVTLWLNSLHYCWSSILKYVKCQDAAWPFHQPQCYVLPKEMKSRKWRRLVMVLPRYTTSYYGNCYLCILQDGGGIDSFQLWWVNLMKCADVEVIWKLRSHALATNKDPTDSTNVMTGYNYQKRLISFKNWLKHTELLLQDLLQSLVRWLVR